MGVPDGSLLDLIDKVRSWITFGGRDPLCYSGEFEMPNCSKMCYECDTKSTDLLNGCHCQNCGRWFCGNCANCHEFQVLNDADGNKSISMCRVCDGSISLRHEIVGNCYEKVHPALTPRESPEPPSPSSSCKRTETESSQSDHLSSSLESRDCGESSHVMASHGDHPSPLPIRCRHSRNEEEEAEDAEKQFLSPSSECYQDSSDMESSSVSARHEFFSCKSSRSSPNDSPCGNSFSLYGRSVQWEQEKSPTGGRLNQEPVAVLEKPNIDPDGPENAEIPPVQEEITLQPLDFENNGRLWYPPPPEDENDEVETNYFAFDDEDDDDIGDSNAVFSSSSSFSNDFAAKDKQSESNEEPLKAVVHGHFRVLVAQLLQGGEINPSDDDSQIAGDWLDVVTTLAWQAAHFVKPDTRGGGSMDPGDYVKVKCIASGSPKDSILVKGVVCTKNIKHKRMTSQYKNPRLLLLGGALEYQKVASQLASFNTLLQQENDHLRMIIGKIEALRPNVLLVEKSVSSYAQQYLLEKEISLVLNVKRPLLERIARCTGALICPSIDNISSARVGHCELFRVEKVTEVHEASNQSNRKPSKTLMHFEGCPRRLGCTVLLRGTCREELKKLKHVVQYAVFAAYHLSLETSFLADEGATLPRMKPKQPVAISEGEMVDEPAILTETGSEAITSLSAPDDGPVFLTQENEESESVTGMLDPHHTFPLSSGSALCGVEMEVPDFQDEGLLFESFCQNKREDLEHSTLLFSREPSQLHSQEPIGHEENRLAEVLESTHFEKIEEDDASSEYFSTADTHQSILVSFSSRCVVKENVCERSRLLRIKFYGSFDKPLGRYLRDDLFDQTSCCRSCKELVDAHVLCYTHQHGNLTINVKRLSSMKLPGEQDGKIWMWHRCLRCAQIDGVPPATRRVVMSDAAWGLSFGKFLELSFSNHATANRVATCGHSLQRDCLRYYGFGSMVAFFRYSPIDILNVFLPPSKLEFKIDIQEAWIRKEAAELLGKMQTMYSEISEVLCSMEDKSNSMEHESSDSCELENHIFDLKDQLMKEKHEYNDALHDFVETLQPGQTAPDILSLNRLRRVLLIGSHAWDRQLYSLNSLLSKTPGLKLADGDARRSLFLKDASGNSQSEESLVKTVEHIRREEEVHSDGEVVAADETLAGSSVSPASSLSERIDSAWTGTSQLPVIVEPAEGSEINGPIAVNSPLKRLARPLRVQSFDSAIRLQERIQKGLPPSSLYLSTLRSFHASGDYRTMVRDPVSNVTRTYSQMLPLEAQKLKLFASSTPTYVSSASHMADGARLLLPQRDHNDVVIAVYDDDPASVISYALNSKEYEDSVAGKSNEQEGGLNYGDRTKDSGSSTFSAWRTFGSTDLDYIHYASYGPQESSSSLTSFFTDDKKSPHLTISFSDDSSSASGKAKFSVTCYFAKQFDSLRKNCCPSKVDFLRSFSRCQKWSAQGGKSNVYFAKSLDERFIIKQVKKTELESFEEFAPEYFKYLTDSLKSGSPTCLAKILGIYQVCIKNLKGGKETKMDLMVMENIFYKRNISRIYDLKGSARSRYNPDTTGTNKVMLDMNLLENLRTEPIFLGSKAKRTLERAIWNDTSFLASVDVMDYSLLVGFDEERKELVLGIIDFMRQYTWDKHLETWVKASGILGGPKNESPTIVSPKQYKKRFRKAMTTYFLTVPDQWSS